jgi:hypothetical protein
MKSSKSVGEIYAIFYVAAGSLFIFSAFPGWVFWVLLAVFALDVVMTGVSEPGDEIRKISYYFTATWFVCFPILFVISVFQIKGWEMGVVSIFVNIVSIIMLVSSLFRENEADKEKIKTTEEK